MNNSEAQTLGRGAVLSVRVTAVETKLAALEAQVALLGKPAPQEAPGYTTTGNAPAAPGIAPCPRCKQQPQVQESGHGFSYVRCGTVVCHWSGPLCDSTEDPITAWNAVMRPWIECSERLPCIHTLVLFETAKRDFVHAGWRSENIWVDELHGNSFIPKEDVLRWQPLPPPKGRGK